MLYSLAGASLGIIDKQVVMTHEVNGDMGAEWLTSNTAGGGPFVLTQWRPNELAMFDANKDYWDGAPAMARVAVRHIPDRATCACRSKPVTSTSRTTWRRAISKRSRATPTW